MNNKGFAITGILYGVLVLFLMVTLSLIGILNEKRERLEKLSEAVNNGENTSVGNDGDSVNNDEDVSCFTIEGNSIIAYDNNCSKDVIIPKQVSGINITSIGSSAFANKGLNSVYIPGTIYSIGDSAFKNNKLSSINLNEGLYKIGHSAFSGHNLTEIEIPGSVCEIKGYAFASTGDSLKKVTINEGICKDNKNKSFAAEYIFNPFKPEVRVYVNLSINGNKLINWKNVTSWSSTQTDFYCNDINVSSKYLAGTIKCLYQ